jgi:penicillin-binding protein 1A
MLASTSAATMSAAAPAKPKLKKLRFLLILSGLAVLAGISALFGMMTAIASDLPSIENRAELKRAKPSFLLDRTGKKELGRLAQQNRVLVRYGDIAPTMRRAVIAIEDQRFYTNEGVDFQGIARALWADITAGEAVQGGSTIPQQLIKDALKAQGNRTILQKMREAALAHHLTRKWSKEKILTEYLNRIYFGNGAYGIEQGARTYFGSVNRCGQRGQPLCAKVLLPEQAALLAGVISSPSGYDPLQHPRTAKRRRNQVLQNMVEQGYISRSYFDRVKEYSVPKRSFVQVPREVTAAPYFTSWVKQQVIDRYGAQRALEGGLRIRTTLDMPMQEAAQNVVDTKLNKLGPSAAVVVIENRTGEVRAMVQGPKEGNIIDDFSKRPFNIATQGQRQPGSSFKPFILAAALRSGISPDSTWESKKKTFTVPNSRGKEKFVVNNYEDNYSGTTSLARATTFSDNSVFAQVCIEVGTKKISKLARRMGIRTKVSSNYALTLGGLKQGVSALDMAHAYETFARGGKLVSGTLAPSSRSPVAIEEVRDSDGDRIARNHRKERRVLPENVAKTTTSILETVLTDGTAADAQLDGFAAGKTGTTENYGDAWFVGYDDFYTTAVWVGYDETLKPMKTEYFGQPVAGGTYPAEIWHDVMTRLREILFERNPKARERQTEPDPADVSGGEGDGTGEGDGVTGDGGEGYVPPEDGGGEDGGAAPEDGGGVDEGGGGEAPAPPVEEPAPTPAVPEDGGGDPGAGGGAGAVAPEG